MKILRGQKHMPRSFVISIALGLGLGIILRESCPWPLIVAMSGVVALVMKMQTRISLVIALWVSIMLGAGRYEFLLHRAAEDTQSLVVTTGFVQGLVVKSWTIDGRSMIELHDVQVSNHQAVGSGQVQFSDPPIISAGEVVRVHCRWEAPKPDQVLRSYSQGLHAYCRFPESFERVERLSSWRASLARWRAWFVQRVQQSYHHPQVDLLAGILFGVQETMGTDVRQQFRATGTSHIVALSGFNITIIVTVLAGTFTAVAGRRLALWPTLAVICMFVVMTGASASVTRAAVMSMIGLVALQLGRPLAASRLLLYTFSGMILVNPFILIHDLGFQLSFLATIGLIYVSPQVSSRLTIIPEWFELRSTLASTLAAMLVTEPLLLWTFGRFSLIAPLVNLLVLPAVPLIMAAGAVSLFVAFAVPLADGLLRFVLGTIASASHWPFAQLALPWWAAGLLASVCVMIMIHFAYVAAKQTSPRR